MCYSCIGRSMYILTSAKILPVSILDRRIIYLVIRRWASWNRWDPLSTEITSISAERLGDENVELKKKTSNGRLYYTFCNFLLTKKRKDSVPFALAWKKRWEKKKKKKTGFNELIPRICSYHVRWLDVQWSRWSESEKQCYWFKDKTS